MTWFTSGDISITNGQKIVVVNDSADASVVKQADALYVSGYDTPAEVSHVSGNNIVLVNNWTNGTVSGATCFVMPVAGDFQAATQAIQNAKTILEGNFQALDDWATQTGNVTFTGADGTEYTVRTAQQMDDDIQAIQDGNQELIDTAVEDKIGEIRYSKLDNPLCHLFKKNKITDTLAGNLTWTRASAATYVDRYGVVRTAAIDEMREEAGGWLIEGASTNELAYSGDFSQSIWTKIGVSISTDGTLAPDGVSEAQLLDFDAPGTSTQVYQIGSFGGVNNTGSAWLKGVEGETIKVETRANNASVVQQAVHTFTGEWERLDSIVDNVPDWSQQTDSLTRFAIRRDVANSAQLVYAWGAQLEKLPFPSSNIPTTDAAVTRAADDISIDYSDNVPSYSTGYSITMRLKPLSIESGFYQNILRFNHETNTQLIRLDNSTPAKVNTYLGGVEVNTAAITSSDSFSFAAVFDAENEKVITYLNGESREATGAAHDNTLTSAVRLFTDANGGGPYYGHAVALRLSDFALNEAEIKFLAGE